MRYTIAVSYPVEPWSTILSFGNASKGLEEGIIIGAWEDDIWFGLKPRKAKISAWQSLGKNFIVQIWRHTCVSIDFDTHKVQ